jgi:putative membrane protein
VFSLQDAHELILTLVYSVVGMLVFATFFVLVIKFAPIPVIKEIEEDQNVALAILIGAVVIGLSIIIAAAIV